MGVVEFVQQSSGKSTDGCGFGRGNERPGDGHYGCGGGFSWGVCWGDGWGDGHGSGYLDCSGSGFGFGSGSGTGVCSGGR